MVHIASFRSVSSPKPFPDFRDFRKNLVPGVTDNLSPRKLENFPFVLEFDETFLGH